MAAGAVVEGTAAMPVAVPVPVSVSAAWRGTTTMRRCRLPSGAKPWPLAAAEAATAVVDERTRSESRRPVLVAARAGEDEGDMRGLRKRGGRGDG